MIPLLLVAAVLATQDSAGLTLPAAIDRALATHPSVAASRADRDAAAAAVGQANAAWLPALTLAGGINEFEKPMLIYPLHGLDFSNLPAFARDLSQAEMDVTYTLADFGARASRVRAAVAEREAASAGLSAAEQQLVARTATAYLDVLSAREILAAQDQRLTSLGAEAARARSLFAAGKTARVDTLRAAAELASARADRLSSVAALDVSEHDLARLIGAPFQTVHGVPLATVRVAPAVSEADLQAMRADLVERADRANADVQAAARRADAAQAAVGSAKSALYPQVQATGAIVDRSDVTGAYLAEWQVGVAVSYPLFTGGARASAIGVADATARSAQQQLRLARLSTAQQVDATLASLEEARARAGALDVAVAQAVEVARITALGRDAGQGTQTDFLLAEANLFAARSSLVKARHAVISARVELARVLGELTPSWIASSLESLP